VANAVPVAATKSAAAIALVNVIISPLLIYFIIVDVLYSFVKSIPVIS
jgi:hypothetical protein